ncbi:MAG: DUF1844 domain-containing protein [Armatimonadetes bacterium]|nr:DUF1844 domain-containing protein [Armatimonadota bacterium]
MKDSEAAEVPSQAAEETAPPESPAEEVKAEEPKAEQAAAGQEEAEIPPPDVYSILEFMATMLAEQAWQFMGIRLAPGQKELIKDLTQAKVAIDTLAFIADKLHPQMSEPDRLAMRGLVSDLQINFVRQSQQ